MHAAITLRACLALLAVAPWAAWPSALGDVGDAWRALLLGAPPALLSLRLGFIASWARAAAQGLRRN